MTEVEPGNWTMQAEELAGKLKRFQGPAFRKAYLANLMASGSRLAAAGDLRSSGYCFDKVALALKDIIPMDTASDARVGPLDSKTAAQAQASPLESLRHHWREARLTDAEGVLGRQGGRLSTLENQVYRDKLEKLRTAGKAAATPLQAKKVDVSLQGLRSQLYRRVLKSQKVSLRRKHAPDASLRNFLLMPGARPSDQMASAVNQPGSSAKSALGKVEPAATQPTGAQVLQAIVGPYNDRYNLGDLLALLAQADAAWVEEFLDLYRGLLDLKGLLATAKP